MLYLARTPFTLGLCYGATSLALEALDCYLACVVPDAKHGVPGGAAGGGAGAGADGGAHRVHGGPPDPGIGDLAAGADVTSVKARGEWVQLGLTVDDVSGLVLTLDALEGEDAETLQEWVAPVAEAVGAELLVTDDADAFKGVADNLDLEHQVCISHACPERSRRVTRNTEALAEEVLEALGQDAPACHAAGSLSASGVTPEQAVGDLRRMGECIRTRDPGMVDELEEIHLHYKAARAPSPGERVDGTNNACERATGSRSATGRCGATRAPYGVQGPRTGSKHKRSALNVSRLIIFCGNLLKFGGVDLGELFA